jgi:hypothetical protein
MIRYIFIVEDFHFVFLAGLPAHGSNLRRRFHAAARDARRRLSWCLGALSDAVAGADFS